MKHSNHDHTPNKGADHQQKSGKVEQGQRSESMNAKGQGTSGNQDLSGKQRDEKSQKADKKRP